MKAINFIALYLLGLLITAQPDSATFVKLDSIVKTSMEAKGIVGCSYAVVLGDSILSIKSFGYANLEQEELLTNQHQHMFGSISKLITANLVVQLVQEGTLDLEKDIREYVPEIRLSYRTTLHHLLTHTGGFEEQILDRVKLEGMESESLEEYMIRRMPRQIIPPGEVAAYSNHGVALAGLIAAKVTGSSFEQLVNEKIFEQYGMQDAGFGFTEKFNSGRATPYMNGQESSVEFVQTIPASMMVGTIKDLAKFMVAHLNDEGNNSKAIATMTRTQFQPNEFLYGRGYGYFVRVFRGKRGLQHGNTRNGYFGLLHLIPEDSLGIVVTATGSNGSFRNDVVYGLLRALYPTPDQNLEESKIDKSELNQYVGSFNSTRTNETRVEKILHKLRPGTIEIKANESGLIAFGDEYKYIGNHTFQVVDGSHRIAFRKTDYGTYLMLPGRSDFYVKSDGWSNPMIHIGILIVSILLMLFLAIRSAIVWKKKEAGLQKNFSLAINLSGTIFLVGFTVTVSVIGNGLQYGIPTVFYGLFVFPIVTILAFLGWTVITVINKDFNWKNVSYCVFLALYIYELSYWNYIGWMF